MKTQSSHRLWMVLALGGVMLLGLALSGNTDGTCAPVDPTPYCTSASDCGGAPPVDCEGAWQCEDGVCVFACDDPFLPPETCHTNADCAAGEFCHIEDRNVCCPADEMCLMYMPVCEGECRPIEEPPLECRSDSDCGWNEACVDGRCEELPPPPSECWSDADCGPGMFCQMDEWCWNDCPPDMDCAQPMYCGGVCMPIEPPPEMCWSDVDCGPGMFCQMEDWCLNECPDGENCFDAGWCSGVCVPIEPPPFECWSDADCGPGMFCQMHESCWYDCPEGMDCAAERMACGGFCLPVEPPPEMCFSDEDCGPGMRCDIDPWLNCGVPDCPEGEDCDPAAFVNCGGVCVPIEPPPAECWSNADCPAGMACEFLYDCDVPFCENGDCEEPFWGCPGVCVRVEPGPEYPYCESDADCFAGEFCDLIDIMPYMDPNDPSAVPCFDEDGDGLCDDWAQRGICTPIEQPPMGCTSDADCGPNEQCVMTCSGGGACPPGEPCWDVEPECWGECVPVEPPPFECWSDYDCGPGMRCQIDDWCMDASACDADGDCYGDAEADMMWCGGVCVPIEEPECWSDADCRAGYHCEQLYWAMSESSSGAFMPCFDEDGDGVCDSWEDEPGQGGVCVPNDPPPGDCSADWECAADERCQIDWNICEAGCGPNMDCVACVGRCVPIKECLDDSDCPGGTICDLDEWGCWDMPGCDPASGEDCMPAPCMGVCREPDFWSQA